MAESFRATLTSILFSDRNGGGPRVLVLSSAGPSEGKTTTATNLALALAEIDRRVLLIDADLRRPRLHSIFDVDNEIGLAELLKGDAPVAPFNGHVRPTGVPNLSLLTSGGDGKGNPTLLHSQRFAEVMEAARDSYDMVIVDTPPMMTMADARVVARHADGVILVARAHQTSRNQLKDACQRLTEDGIKLLGVVLNCWDPKYSTHYGYYRYYDKYKHYYGGSGEGRAKS
jgi:succinoglycan biosynthesis transport protein ExoP